MSGSHTWETHRLWGTRVHPRSLCTQSRKQYGIFFKAMILVRSFSPCAGCGYGDINNPLSPISITSYLLAEPVGELPLISEVLYHIVHAAKSGRWPESFRACITNLCFSFKRTTFNNTALHFSRILVRILFIPMMLMSISPWCRVRGV